MPPPPPDSGEAGPAKDRPDTANAAPQQVPSEDTPSRRRSAPDTHVVADSYLSMGYRGKPRLYILVRRCAYCQAPHCHTGKPEFQAGARMASCRGGRYLVHVVTVEAGAAA